MKSTDRYGKLKERWNSLSSQDREYIGDLRVSPTWSKKVSRTFAFFIVFAIPPNLFGVRVQLFQAVSQVLGAMADAEKQGRLGRARYILVVGVLSTLLSLMQAARHVVSAGHFGKVSNPELKNASTRKKLEATLPNEHETAIDKGAADNAGEPWRSSEVDRTG